MDSGNLIQIILFLLIGKGHVQFNILIYVGDLTISENDSATLTTFKQYLCSCFHMKDLGVLKYFLGIEVGKTSKGI